MDCFGGSCRRLYLWRKYWFLLMILFEFFDVIGLFLELLIPVFGISGDVCIRFQSQSRFICILHCKLSPCIFSSLCRKPTLGWLRGDAPIHYLAIFPKNCRKNKWAFTQCHKYHCLTNTMGWVHCPEWSCAVIAIDMHYTLKKLSLILWNIFELKCVTYIQIKTIVMVTSQLQISHISYFSF